MDEPIELDTTAGARRRLPRRPRPPGTRRLALIGPVVGAALVGLVVGVQLGDDGDIEAAVTTTTKPEPPASVSYPLPAKVSEMSVALGPGGPGKDPSAEWSFFTRDPHFFAFVVEATFFPANADVVFAVRTALGKTLEVGRTTDQESCERDVQDDGYGTCRFDLGVLDKEDKGTWTMRIEKQSDDEARMSTTLTFDRP